MIGGDDIIEPPMRNARWFIYLVRTATGVLEIKSLKKLTGKQLLARAILRMKPYKPRKKE